MKRQTTYHKPLFLALLTLLMMMLSVSPALATDVDADGVDDDKDFCIGDEEIAALGTAGEASLVHYYFGDGWMKNLAQDVGLNLDKAISGYDYSIALKEDETNDVDGADEVYNPTQDNFFSALREIVRQGHVVDIYIFAHGNNEGFSVYDNSAVDNTDYLYADEIENKLAPNKNGCAGHYLPIRMVYSVSCYHSTLNATWTDSVGAKASMGARDLNFYPNQFGNFVDDWKDGRQFGNAVDDADTSWSRIAPQTYITADALFSNPWHCSTKTPLGNNACADHYFPEQYPSMDYDSSQSGKWNMNYTSEKLIAGDSSVTKDDFDFDWRVPTDVAITGIVMTEAWTEVRSRTGTKITGAKAMNSRINIGQGNAPTSQTTRVKATFEVTVKNDSAYNIGAFVLTGPDEARVAEVTIDPLSYQRQAIVAFTVVAQRNADGTMDPEELTWTVDARGDLNDTDTANNTVTLGMLPDYEAELTLNTVEIDDEENPYRTVFTCTAKNNGYTSATASATMEIYFRQRWNSEGEYETLVASHTIPALAPGEESEITTFHEHDIDSAAFSAKNAFICKVDTTETVEETDEDDNETEECIYCYDKEFPEMFDATLADFKIMTVFDDEFLEMDDRIRVFMDNIDGRMDDYIIIIIQYTQSAEYLDLSAEYLDGFITATEFEAELKTQVQQSVMTYKMRM